MAQDDKQILPPQAGVISPSSIKENTHSTREHEGLQQARPAPMNANLLGSAGLNTAGGKAKEATFLDGLKTIHWSDVQEIHQKPCVREALMTGIGSGFGFGGLRVVIGASVWTSCNWAVGSFIVGSFLMHEYCQRKRVLEKQGMKRVVEVIERKKNEKRMEAQTVKDAQKRVKE